MNKGLLFFLTFVVGIYPSAHAANLHGKVSNQAGKPVANAIVTLTPQGLADTTGADGNYSISSTTALWPALESKNRSVSFKHGTLEIILSQVAPILVEVFDTRGNRLKMERVHNASAGVYRWDFEKASQGPKVLLIKATIGQKNSTFPYAVLHGGEGVMGSAASVGGALAKAAAAPDSLKIIADGFKTKTIPIPSLDALVDVALDSLPNGNPLKNPPAPSSGCGKTPTLASGSRTIQSSGQNRSYMLRLPPGYDKSHPYPVVFAFHWNGGTMGDVDGGGTSGYTWSYYGMREKADNSTDSKMIFITPQGNGNGWANSGGQDLALVDDLVKLAKNDLCVDTTRIFSMGFSYGGGMTYAIACARANVFRAAAVYSGAQLSGCTDGTKPIAYIGFHGLRDQTCKIAGGRALRDKFVTNNQCTLSSPPEPAANSLKHVCTSYSGCSPGHPVRWCAFDGAGHSPAPVDGSTSDSGGGDRSWTKDEAWQFFTQF